MSVAAGVATCDKSLGTLESTGGNGKLGGALLTIAGAVALTVAGNTTFIITDTINKAPLTVTADDQSMAVGADNPEFTFTYSGFVNGEDESVIDEDPSCDAENPHTVAETYAITCTGGSDNNYDIRYENGVLTVYGLEDLDSTLLTAYNLIGTSHSLTVKVDPANAGVPILFTVTGDDVTGANKTSETVETDENGNAEFIYSSSNGAVHTITACIDLDTDEVCDGTVKVEQTKYWLTKFLTGGGNAKTGRGNTGQMLTFGGNVGLAATNQFVGQFQVVDHNGSGYHFNKINWVSLATDLQTFTFSADGWTQGNTKAPVTATITVYDGNVGGKNKLDTIGVSLTSPNTNVIVPTATNLTGGNLKVFVK